MKLFFYALGFLIFLLVTHRIVRHNQIIAWMVFLVCPFLLLQLAIHQNSNYFIWIKVYSVCLGAAWLLACRYTSLLQWKKALWMLWAFFALNILEAIIEGILTGNILNYINCIPGILLFFTLPTAKEIHVDTNSPTRDLLWNTPLMWIIGYSIWNWTFLYITWPQFGLRHLIILLASLLISIRNNKLWIQSRAFILGIYLLIHFSYDALFKPLDISVSYNFSLAMTTVIFGTIWMAIYSIQFVSKIKTR